MSNVDTSKVYLFLSQNKDWQSVADTTGDGRVIKSEFRQYMLGNFDWNGEDASAKTDLINAFWKEIDTVRGGKITGAGTTLNNKGTLDDSELNNLNEKIEMYDTLNTFIKDNVSAPNVVSDKTGWKQSVSESLTNLAKQYITANKKATVETLKEYLAEQLKLSENKTTADYCATQYLSKDMKSVLSGIDYAYGDDNTLKSMINNYISTLSKDAENTPSAEEIQQTVESIIDEYFATAGLTESDGNVDLSKYGYAISDDKASQPLNDLQKAIIKSNMQSSLSDITKESDYNTYKSLYDEAVNSYIEEILSKGNFANFEEIQGYGITEFVNESTQYKSVKKAIEVQSYVESDEFKNALSTQISSSLSDLIFKGMKSERPESYNTLISEVIEKVKNGDFEDGAGYLDKAEMQKYIISSIKSNLAEYYQNGFSDMSLDELGTLYDRLVEAAKENDSADDLKSAAISYCNAISKKSTTLAQAVKDVFGAGYANAINNMKSYEVESKMTELKAKVEEIGDFSSCKLVGWNTSIGDSINLVPNTTNTYSISANITNNKGSVSPDKISYATNNSNAKVKDGVLTITAPSGSSEYTIEVYAMIGEERIGEAKKIKVSCQQKDAKNISSERNVLVNGEYLEDLIAKHKTTLKISDFQRVSGSDSDRLNASKAAAKESIKNVITKLVSDLTAAGYNTAKLQLAATTTINYYNAAIDAITDQKYGDNDKGSLNMNFSYVDGSGQSHAETSSYYQHTRKHEKNADWDIPCKSMGNDSTGIQMNESYNNSNTYNFYINTGVLLNRFMNFMNI